MPNFFIQKLNIAVTYLQSICKFTLPVGQNSL